MSASSNLSLIASQYDANTNRAGILTLAALRVNVSWFGAKYDLAVAYVAAHMLAMSDPLFRANGEAGAISSKKEGDLSIGYSTGGSSSSSGGGSDYDQTSFGRQFEQLSKECDLAINIIGC